MSSKEKKIVIKSLEDIRNNRKSSGDDVMKITNSILKTLASKKYPYMVLRMLKMKYPNERFVNVSLKSSVRKEIKKINKEIKLNDKGIVKETKKRDKLIGKSDKKSIEELKLLKRIIKMTSIDTKFKNAQITKMLKDKDNYEYTLYKKSIDLLLNGTTLDNLNEKHKRALAHDKATSAARHAEYLKLKAVIDSPKRSFQEILAEEYKK